jgi:D-glycero-D-manno-heptose 1,7-bisphosphate phosphatase
MGQKVAFLDRDGVLNKEIGNYVCKLEDFLLLEHGFENCKKLKEAGYRIIVVTNQGGIAKQMYTKETVEEIHDYMVKEYHKHHVDFLEVLYCPHHSLLENCFCRKPKGLMLEKMIAKYNLDPRDCFLIGDNARDVNAAKEAGVLDAFEIPSNTNWLSTIEPFL